MTFFTGSNLARNIFGQETSSRTVAKTQPLLGFQFFVKINYDPVAKLFIEKVLGNNDFRDSSSLVKSITMPSMSMDTKTINSYNRKRLAQTRINFDPVTISFHDVAGGLTLSLWQIFYNWYYNDGIASLALKKEWLSSPPWESIDIASLLSSPMSFALESYSSEGTNLTALKSFGFSAPYIRYLFKSIDIYQVHGATYNKVTLFNPMIVNFTHDTMAYDKNDLVQLNYQFAYEWAEYEIKNKPITGTMRDFFSRSRVIDFVPNDVTRSNGIPPDGSIDEVTGVSGNVQGSLPSAVSSLPTAAVSVLNNQVNIDSARTLASAASLSVPQSFTNVAKKATNFIDISRIRT